MLAVAMLAVSAALAVVAFLFVAAFFFIATASLIDLLIDFTFAPFFFVFHTRWVVNSEIAKESGASRMASTAASHSLFFEITFFQLASALTPLSVSPTAVNSTKTPSRNKGDTFIGFQ